MPDQILPDHPAERMLDLNDLRIFAYVASLASFSSAADALQIHKSSVSRSVARLEAMLEISLIQRTTRKLLLTPRGVELNKRCVEMLSRINEAIGYAGSLGDMPQTFSWRTSPATLAREKNALVSERRALGSLGNRIGQGSAGLGGQRPNTGRVSAAA